MAGRDDVQHRPRKVRPRARRPRSTAFKGCRYFFTTNIASYTVPVFVSRGLLSGDAVGYYAEEEQEIAVQLPGPNPAAEADRMLHEHLHALSGILLPPEKRLDENQVNTLSTGLIDTLIRNPRLWEFLSQRIAPVSLPETRDALRGCLEASHTSAGTTEKSPSSTDTHR